MRPFHFQPQFCRFDSNELTAFFSHKNIRTMRVKEKKRDIQLHSVDARLAEVVYFGEKWVFQYLAWKSSHYLSTYVPIMSI